MTYHSASLTAVTEGVMEGTLILTLAGEKPVESLAVGDRIITRSGARAVRTVHKTVLAQAEMLCISASALGVEQPPEDMFVAPQQGINIRDWRAKALKKVAQAVIPARDLVDGEYIRRQMVEDAALYQLEFAAPEVIYANGVEVTCTPMAQAVMTVA